MASKQGKCVQKSRRRDEREEVNRSHGSTAHLAFGGRAKRAVHVEYLRRRAARMLDLPMLCEEERMMSKESWIHEVTSTNSFMNPGILQPASVWAQNGRQDEARDDVVASRACVRVNE